VGGEGAERQVCVCLRREREGGGGGGLTNETCCAPLPFDGK